MITTPQPENDGLRPGNRCSADFMGFPKSMSVMAMFQQLSEQEISAPISSAQVNPDNRQRQSENDRPEQRGDVGPILCGTTILRGQRKRVSQSQNRKERDDKNNQHGNEGCASVRVGHPKTRKAKAHAEDKQFPTRQDHVSILIRSRIFDKWIRS